MFYYLSNLAIIFFEVICCKIFFEIFHTQKEKPRKQANVVLVLSLVSLDYLFVIVFYRNFIIKEIVVILTIAVFMHACQRIGFIRAVVFAALYQGLLLLVDFIVYVMNNKIFVSEEVMESEYIFKEGMIIAFGKILLFLFIILLKKIFSNKSTDILTNIEWLRFLIFPVFTILTISALLITFKQTNNQSQSNVLCIIAFGMVGMNLVVFYLINNILEREKKIQESKSFEWQVRSQTKLYHSISENYEQQKVKSHEFQNIIMCIESLVRDKDFPELERYISKISSNFNNERIVINTNHVIINAVLNTKYAEALSKNIVVIFRVNDLSDLQISDEDLVIILSNLLNNAIEACEQCERNRVLKLKFVREESLIILSVKNTCNHKVIVQNNEIKTSKIVKPEEHGIGIKNIIKALEKYDASYVIKNDKEDFYFSIMFNI